MQNDSSIMEIKGIGQKTADLFQKIDITTVSDLLHSYPRDYETMNPPVSIASAPQGEVVTVYACVRTVLNEKKVRNLSILNVDVADTSGILRLTFFNMGFLKKTLKPGVFYIFRGVMQHKGPSYIMEQPKIYTYEDYKELTNRLLPKYSLTKGLSNQTFQKAIRNSFKQNTFSAEIYPDEFLQKYDLLPEREALEKIHFPKDTKDIIIARKRLVFDEFFYFLYYLKRNKDTSEGLPNAYPLFETADTVRFIERLPFPLTKAQKKVWTEIRNDLSSPYCMNRLVQGDVGSGKTILATLALLMVCSNGYQGALMAPTEVLAIQHFETFTNYIKEYHLPFQPVLLIGSMTAKEKKAAYDALATGVANLVIGTHAIIQDKVTFQNLALVVTDEQHRFGVRQREKLSEKGSNPHILVMSATPIPRTLAIILYGDLHISVVDELPANRLPIKNCVVNTSYRPKAYQFIAKQVEEGRQVYVICPQVEPGEMDDLENVVEYADKLKAVLPGNIRVSYLHGKMKPAVKTNIMEEFAKKSIDVLVSTTVIEVGINVPNATVMMVENADRFGLAQLHQLRGRVGRGEYQSYCIFISSMDKKETIERLQILNNSNDGFHIASEDLKLRGPGDLFGIRQSGEFSFRLGDIYADAGILSAAQNAVDYVLSNKIVSKVEYQNLVQRLSEAERNNVDFRTI